MDRSTITTEDLAEVRRRMQAALLDSSLPMPARMDEFRRLLRESQLCAARIETTWQSLLDSF